MSDKSRPKYERYAADVFDVQPFGVGWYVYIPGERWGRVGWHFSARRAHRIWWKYLEQARQRTGFYDDDLTKSG